jgi:hypothetical protein
MTRTEFGMWWVRWNWLMAGFQRELRRQDRAVRASGKRAVAK